MASEFASDPAPSTTVHSLLGTDFLADLLTPLYPFDGGVEVRFWRGRFADVYRVEDSGGSYALRILPARAPRAFLEFQLEALRFLRFRRSAVVAPVPQRNGRLVLEIDAPEGKRIGVLFPWVEGPGLGNRRDPSTLEEVGSSLARLHLELDAWGPIEPPVPTWNRGTLLDRSLASLEQVLGPGHGALEPLARAGADAIGALESLPQGPGIQGLVHGDPDPSNIRVGKDGPALIDFDHMGIAPRVWDLAILRFESEWCGWPEQDYRHIEAGYSRRRALSDEERGGVDALVPLRSIQALGLFARDSHRLGEEWLRVRHLDRHLRFLEARRD